MERFLTDPSRLLTANDPSRFEDILQQLYRRSDIEVLILQDCKIDDNGAIRLARALSNCRRLVFFDVQKNLITAQGSEVLCSALSELGIQVGYVQDRVKIGEAFIGNRFSILSVSILLTPGSAITMTLQELCLSEMNLGDEGMDIVAKRLEYLVELVKLFFYHNAVGEAGASSLARFLPRALKLRYIKLIENYIPSRFKGIFEEVNQIRKETMLPEVNIDMTKQLVPEGEDVAREWVRKITGMDNGKKIDFFALNLKFTPHGKELIERANQLRMQLGLERLDIKF